MRADDDKGEVTGTGEDAVLEDLKRLTPDAVWNIEGMNRHLNVGSFES